MQIHNFLLAESSLKKCVLVLICNPVSHKILPILVNIVQSKSIIPTNRRTVKSGADETMASDSNDQQQRYI